MTRTLPAVLMLVLTAVSCHRSTTDKPAAARSETTGRPMRVYIGTYTNAKSKGIYLMDLDPAAGSLSAPKLVAETTSPSFLALHPSRRLLYAVNEVDNFQGQKGGSVSAFSVDPSTGELRLLNQQSSGGSGPCHLDLDRTGRAVIVANYGSGSVAMLPVLSDGRLKPPAVTDQHTGSSVNKQRQEGPHAHCANVVGGRALVADLGLDKVFVYSVDAGSESMKLEKTAAAAAGAGPRHLAVHPTGRFMYVVNELNSTITAYDAQGNMPALQTLSTLPDGYTGNNSCAEIQMHPSGRFVYGSNRGHDSIAAFAIDARTGKLTSIGQFPTQGRTPRNFNIDPSGRFLLAANQASDTVVVFRIDPKSGKLEPTGSVAQVPTPVCVVFAPAGK